MLKKILHCIKAKHKLCQQCVCDLGNSIPKRQKRFLSSFWKGLLLIISNVAPSRTCRRADRNCREQLLLEGFDIWSTTKATTCYRRSSPPLWSGFSCMTTSMSSWASSRVFLFYFFFSFPSCVTTRFIPANTVLFGPKVPKAKYLWGREPPQRRGPKIIKVLFTQAFHRAQRTLSSLISPKVNYILDV